MAETAVPTTTRSIGWIKKQKKIYANRKNLILNYHPILISEGARHCLYRVHGVEIGTK